MDKYLARLEMVLNQKDSIIKNLRKSVNEFKQTLKVTKLKIERRRTQSFVLLKKKYINGNRNHGRRIYLI